MSCCFKTQVLPPRSGYGALDIQQDIQRPPSRQAMEPPFARSSPPPSTETSRLSLVTPPDPLDHADQSLPSTPSSNFSSRLLSESYIFGIGAESPSSRQYLTVNDIVDETYLRHPRLQRIYAIYASHFAQPIPMCEELAPEEQGSEEIALFGSEGASFSSSSESLILSDEST